MFASANRDERQLANPDSFDITRPVEQHMGWGRGTHQCMCKPLARMEITSLFDVLAEHVERSEVGNTPGSSTTSSAASALWSSPCTDTSVSARLRQTVH